jgi:hypothetical protein
MNSEKPSRAWYRPLRGLGSVVNADSVRKVYATAQKPTP